MAYTVIGDEKFLVSATIGAGGSASFDDLSSSPLSATTYNTPTLVADTTYGGTHAIKLDNPPTAPNDQYIDYPDPTGKCNFASSSFTMCCWFKQVAYSPSANYNAVRFGYGATNPSTLSDVIPCAMFWNDRNNRFGFKTDGLSNNWKAVNINAADDGNWHHVMYHYNGSSKRIYFDGSQVLNQSATGSSTSIVGQVRIGLYPGSWTGATPYYNGLLDDLRYFDRALTTTEIASLSSGRTSAPPASGVYNPFKNNRFNAGNARVR